MPMPRGRRAPIVHAPPEPAGADSTRTVSSARSPAMVDSGHVQTVKTLSFQSHR